MVVVWCCPRAQDERWKREAPRGNVRTGRSVIGMQTLSCVELGLLLSNTRRDGGCKKDEKKKQNEKKRRENSTSM
jgi:hypothetical protein